MPASTKLVPVIVRVVDLETTGSRPPEHGVVEIGWQDVEAEPALDEGASATWRVSRERGALLVDPRRPIPAQTSAIHHLVDEDVAGAPTWLAAATGVLGPPGRSLSAFAAHRADFERRWCVDALTGGRPWVCTWKCALRLWPSAPSFSNQVLRYWRRPDGLDRALALPAHRAGPDAYVTAHHLRDMLRLASLDQLVAWTREPALLVRVPYGANRGRRWSEVDDAFLDHLLSGGSEGDGDVRFTARRERERRARERGGEGAPAPAAMIDRLL